MIEQILQDYKGWLHRVAMDLTSNIEHQKDVVQVGKIAMWRALQRYDASKGALPSFLTQAARWAMQEEAYGRYSTRDKRIQETAVDPESPMWEELVSSEVLADIQEAYHHGQIQQALSRLSPDQREYVYRRFWLDQSEPEIRASLLKSNPVHYLWTDKRNGARKQLAESLTHLKE